MPETTITPRVLPGGGDVSFSFTDDTTDQPRRTVGETTATMASTISITNGSINSVTQVGMDLYDANGNYIVTGTDEGATLKPKNGVINNWYIIAPGSSDINMSLSRGTTYRYRFWAKYNGSTYYDDFKFFTTTTTESYLDLNGLLNGESSGSIEGFGTVDVYINGSLVADDVADYYVSWPVGTTWQIADIKTTGSYYNGIYSGGLSGTIGNERVNVVLEFERPGKPTVSVSPGTSLSETVLSWGATDRTTHYDVRIYDASGKNLFENENPPYRQMPSGILQYHALLPAGNYTATVSATNVEKGAWMSSDTVSFTVAYADYEPGDALTWQEAEHRLYVVYDRVCSWMEAREICAHEAGTFASITNQTQQDAVAAAVADFEHPVWLGAEAFQNKAFQWVNGDAMSYTNWDPGEPNNGCGLENCLVMLANGNWNDHPDASDIGNDYHNVCGYVVQCEPVKVYVDYYGYPVPSGTIITKDDLVVQPEFENGITVVTEDYTIQQSGTGAGEQTITVTYGPVTGTTKILFYDPMDEPDFVLPDDLVEIQSDAFAGIKAQVIKCPEGLEEIGSNAFSNCTKLRQIYIPENTITISRSAFSGCNASLVIYGVPGSTAETFANARGFEFREYMNFEPENESQWQ